ncbi:MAG TPA: nucleotidyltransferase domain-containing protein [Polyangiaceae bacterium]|nr:nucleotidyltransferase domain-containing protein [Polyangiaceae bacterium]
MDVRLRNLASLDPLAVPLPNGTEVVSRVDRLLEGGRRVPQGALGRVVSQDGERFVVRVVGVGDVPYRRDELVPHKSGQWRYARRRAAAWDALRPCAVLETRVGSHAWGLADENSDTDLRGLFALPFAWGAGLGAPPLDLVSADGSATYWELGKGLRQALRADPNTLETLFVPSARALDPIGEWVLQERDAFVSIEIYGSFGRYALSQLKRVGHTMRLYEHREKVLEWLRETPTPSLDEVALRLSSSTRARAPSEAEAILQAKEYIKQLYRSLFDQGLLPARDFGALAEFARSGKAAEFDLPREVRPKNAYNLLRLLSLALGWLREGRPRFEAEGPLRELLLSIKKGGLSLGEVMERAEAMAPELEEARNASPLPKRPDVARADALLRRINDEIARRHVHLAPGPWGRDAPPPPPIAWGDDDDEGEAPP